MQAVAESTLPGFVKAASQRQMFGSEHDPSSLFADPAARTFYVGTKAGVWLSASQFQITGCTNQTISENIKQAARVHGILREIIPVLQILPTLEKAAAEVPDSHFGLVTTVDGQTTRHFRLESHADIETAAGYFPGNKQHLAGAQRQKFASAILKRAREESVDLPAHLSAELQKYAGEGEYTVAGLQSALRTRQALLGFSSEAAEKLQSLVQPTAERLPVGHRQKVAAWLTDFDVEFGLDRQYGNGLVDPHDTLFGISKSAIETVLKDNVALINGTVFCKSDLQKVAVESIEDALGDEIATEVRGLFGVDVTKLAAVLPSLSRSQAAQFQVCARQHGVVPV